LQGDAGATFVHKEIERVIDTASAVLFTFFNPGKVAGSDWQRQIQAGKLRFG